MAGGQRLSGLPMPAGNQAAQAPITGLRRISATLWRKPAMSAGLLLSLPLGWLVLIYLAALAALFISAFWTIDSFTGDIDRNWTLANFQAIFDSPIYRWIALRTILMAAAVTLTDIV